MDKPFTRKTSALSIRLLLPATLTLNLAFGLNLWLDPFARVIYSHAYTFPRSLTNDSMVPWSLPFLALSVILGVALIARKRTWSAYALCMSTVTWAGWGCTTMRSVVIDAQASPVGPLLICYIAFVSLVCTLVVFEGSA